MQELVGEKLAVRFNQKEKTEHTFSNGLKIEIADAWEHSEGTEEQHKLVNHNVNKIDVNPQTATVIISGENPFFKVGDVIFTHYLAYEHQEIMETDEGELSVIDTELVIFKVENGEKILPDGYFLGKQIMETEIKLDSGLFLNVVEKKKSLTVEITHVPKKPSHIELKDVIQSVDDFNYQFDYEGEKYIFIKEEEIVAKVR